MNLQNNLGFSLYTTLSVYHVVTTSDRRKKSEMEVSTDWYVAIKYQRLSLIRIIFVNYQTSKLQYNYQSYIQVRTIENAWSFSGIVSIAPSKGFSSKTLAGV